MKKILVSILALGLSTAGVMAQDAAPAAPDFATIDVDKSGDLSFAEVQTAWPDLTEDAFKGADSDASGALSEAELTAYLATRPATP